MDDTRALSPEVKTLFKAVENQARDYNRAFEVLSREIKALIVEKTSLNDTLANLTNKVDVKLDSLEQAHQKAIDELEETTQKALSLHNELELVKELRIDLEEKAQSIIKSMNELNMAIKEFKYKSEKEIAQTLKSIEDMSESALEKESQKIEVRLSLKSKQTEQKVSAIEGKIIQLNDTVKKDLRMMMVEVDDVKSDTERLKNITNELNNAILMTTEEVELNIDNKFSQVEALVEKVQSRMEELELKGFGGGSGGAKSDDPFGDLPASNFGSVNDITSKLKAKAGSSSGHFTTSGKSDNNNLAKDINSIATKIDELNTENEQIGERINPIETKGNLALWFAGASLVGVIILFIIMLTK